MLRFEWSKAVKRPFPVVLRARRRGPRSPWTRFVPRLDPMEDRTLLSTLTVLNNHDSGAGSLRVTITAAHSGDTIDFAKSVHAITLTSGELTINKSLDIEGPGADKLTISGNKASRVFDIKAGETVTLAKETVTLANLTIADGLALVTSKQTVDLGGGGILNEPGAVLTVDHVAFTGNQAQAKNNVTSDVLGGGLLNEGTAFVTFSTFTNNKALGGGVSFTNDAIGGSAGGAIDNFGFGGAKLKVTHSTFDNNQALGAAGPNFGIGGAIENNAGLHGSTPSTATIDTSIFVGNLASGDTGAVGNGGAIDNEGTGTVMTLSNSMLLNNQSVGGPGGDFSSNPTFSTSQGIGGGFLNAGGTVTVTKCTLTGNKAQGGEGSAPTATENPFTGIGFGGAIVNAGTLTVTDSTLTGNLASGVNASTRLAGTNGRGGGLLNAGGTVTVKHSTIDNNQALGGQGGNGGGNGGNGEGGGILNDFGGTVTVEHSTIDNNQALGGQGGNGGGNGGDGLGGGLYNGGDSTLSLKASTVTGNYANGGEAGGGGSDGHGVGGGVYNLGTFLPDGFTLAHTKKNHASTSNDDIFPTPM